MYRSHRFLSTVLAGFCSTQIAAQVIVRDWDELQTALGAYEQGSGTQIIIAATAEIALPHDDQVIDLVDQHDGLHLTIQWRVEVGSGCWTSELLHDQAGARRHGRGS